MAAPVPFDIAAQSKDKTADETGAQQNVQRRKEVGAGERRLHHAKTDIDIRSAVGRRMHARVGGLGSFDCQSRETLAASGCSLTTDDRWSLALGDVQPQRAESAVRLRSASQPCNTERMRKREVTGHTCSAAGLSAGITQEERTSTAAPSPVA